jgi:hypothetical protein
VFVIIKLFDPGHFWLRGGKDKYLKLEEGGKGEVFLNWQRLPG